MKVSKDLLRVFSGTAPGILTVTARLYHQVPGSVVDSVHAPSNPKHIGSVSNTASEMPWKIRCLCLRNFHFLWPVSRLEGFEKTKHSLKCVDPMLAVLLLQRLYEVLLECQIMNFWVWPHGMAAPGLEKDSAPSGSGNSPLLWLTSSGCTQNKIDRTDWPEEQQHVLIQRAQRCHGNGPCGVDQSRQFTCCRQIDFGGIDGTKRLRVWRTQLVKNLEQILVCQLKK